MLPHKVTKLWSLSWSPSTALPSAPSSCPRHLLGLSQSRTHMVTPQPLKKVTPSSSSQDPVAGAGAGASHPEMSLGIGVRRFSSLLVAGAGAGYWQTKSPDVRGASEAALYSCREQTADPAPALDPDEAGGETDPRWESPGLPAEPTPGMLTGGVSGQDSRSPWTGAARLDWKQAGKFCPESQG